MASNCRSGSGGTFGGGGGENDLGSEELSPWYLTTLSISYDGGKAVGYTKTTTNRWTFSMPAGNVVISGTFSQTPVKSVYLEILSVSVNSTITPKLEYKTDKYTAEIPHIFPTVPDQKFSIIAIPEDPDAAVSISSGVEDADGEIPLNEGTTEYTITVERAELETKKYNFTVDYEPDLALKSIELSSAGHPEWTHPVTVQDGQTLTLTVPYDSAAIAASPNDDTVALAASKTGGEGDFSATDANTWTLTYTGENKQSIHTTARIESSKTVDDKLYKKEYTLNIEKTVDPEYPTSFWATSTPEDNGTSIIKKDGKYYEVHTFITSGTLSIDSVPDAGLTAQVLVVAGGGGAGGAAYPSSGAGAGGMVENNNYSITTGSYTVVVGAGGTGGAPKPSGGQPYDGTNGEDSVFGDPEAGGILAYGGGASLKRGTSGWASGTGNNGGSGGGGGYSGGTKKDGIDGDSYGNPGGAVSGGDNIAAGGGGAGDSGSSGAVKLGDNKNGLYGGAGRPNDISGQTKVYAAGGMTTPYNNNEHHAGKDGAPNTGDGGGGGWQNKGGNGGSGIVIVRFPAKVNS